MNESTTAEVRDLREIYTNTETDFTPLAYGLGVFVILLVVFLLSLFSRRNQATPELKPEPELSSYKKRQLEELAAKARVAAYNQIIKFETTNVRVKGGVVPPDTEANNPGVEISVEWSGNEKQDSILYLTKSEGEDDRGKRKTLEKEIDSHPIRLIDSKVKDNTIYRYYVHIEAKSDGTDYKTEEQYIIHKVRLPPLTAEEIAERERIKKEKEAAKAAKELAKKKAKEIAVVKKKPPVVVTPKPEPESVEKKIEGMVENFIAPIASSSRNIKLIKDEIRKRVEQETEGEDEKTKDLIRAEVTQKLEEFLELAKNKTTE